MVRRTRFSTIFRTGRRQGACAGSMAGVVGCAIGWRSNSTAPHPAFPFHCMSSLTVHLLCSSTLPISSTLFSTVKHCVSCLVSNLRWRVRIGGCQCWPWNFSPASLPLIFIISRSNTTQEICNAHFMSHCSNFSWTTRIETCQTMM